MKYFVMALRPTVTKPAEPFPIMDNGFVVLFDSKKEAEEKAIKHVLCQYAGYAVYDWPYGD